MQRVDCFEKGEPIISNVPGGGGTAFSPTFKWIEENAEQAAAIVYFTDLDCSDYGPEPDTPVMWLAYGHPQRLPALIARVPWGEVIELRGAA